MSNANGKTVERKFTSGPEIIKELWRVFPPRLLLVDYAVTENDKRSVGLVLINREASARFKEHFPTDAEACAGSSQAYARAHAINTLADHTSPQSSLPHRVKHFFPGTNFPIGSVLTEKQVFDLGYVEPYVYTLCAQIAQVDDYLATPGHQGITLTQALREAGLIEQTHFAALHLKYRHTELGIFDHEPRVDELQRSSSLGKAHLAQLLLFGRGEDALLTVGGGYYVPKTNTIYEFITKAPPISKSHPD